MSELGQLLKQSRMEKGISLDDLQETTKIQKRYLVAIEEGNYKILPGSFYVRAFIKSYAEEVGLKPNEVLKMYHSVIPSPHPEQTIEPIRKKRNNSRNMEIMNKWISSIVLWSFVILIAGIIYYFIFYYNSGGRSNVLDDHDTRITELTESPEQNSLDELPDFVDSNEDPPLEDPLATVEEEDEIENIPVVRLAKSEGGIDYYELENVEKIKLELKVVGDECWIQVNELYDGNQSKTVEVTTIKSGEERLYEVESGLHLRTGKANALEIKINGEIVPNGEMPNPKRFQFNLIPS